ncbi:hypothetical protein XENOCAPTIV_004048 [Xenoophorus captivus]|uniref:Uncharacterized protein n=1 Tax=Xenoophorus captivus TaxID=1517983 RepID=A0ABV0QDP8_9TELE
MKELWDGPPPTRRPPIRGLKWSNDENPIWETHPLLQLHPMASPCITVPTNQHQVCSNPQPMILQSSAFKVSHSWISQLSAELPLHHQYQIRGKTILILRRPSGSCIISIHVFLWGLSAKQINIHCVTSLIAFCVSYCESLQD